MRENRLLYTRPEKPRQAMYTLHPKAVGSSQHTFIKQPLHVKTGLGIANSEESKSMVILALMDFSLVQGTDMNPKITEQTIR